MKKVFIYFASFCSKNNYNWYSAGANLKIRQTLLIAKESNKRIFFVNFTPKEKLQLIVKTFNICKSFNPIKYRAEILFSFFKIKKYFNNDILNLILYNATFVSLLFYLSVRLNKVTTNLIIQIEDLPCARDSNIGIKGFLDKFAFIFLIKRSSHIFFASQGMLIQAKKNYDLKCGTSVYSPHLSKEYLEIIQFRKEPFNSEKIKVMYAGSFRRDKGVYELADAFIEANMPNYELVLYGPKTQEFCNYYNRFNSINIFGIVTLNELYKAYSESDIIINPHLKIINNQFIAPFKNIEIFATGALTMFSKYAVEGVPVEVSQNLCLYESKNDLVDLIKNSRSIWKNKSTFLKNLSIKIRNQYKFENIKNEFDKGCNF